MAQSESPAMFKKEEYTTYNGVNVTCYIGDITQAAADGIVTGQGWDLTKPGLVTEALCASAQIPPADFSKIIIGLHKSKHLDRGDTCCLSPREHHIRLKFKTVIMAGVLHFKDAWTKSQWKHQMENLYIKVLNKANDERLESVALPLLGCGTPEVPLSAAAEALVAALLTFRTKCLSKVFVVSTGGNTHGEIIKQLENYFTAESGPKSKTESTRQPHSYLDKHKVDTKGANILGKGNFNQEVNTKEAEDHFYRGKDNSVGVLESPEMFKKEEYTTYNGVDVTCYIGDITQADADGIVTGQVWDLTKPGAVTKQLCDSAQIDPADFSKIIIGLHKSKYLETGDICCLSPREHHIKLKFKTVIMAGVFNIKNAQNIDQWKHEMESLYIKILNTANEERLESVALPVLGSGTPEVPLSLAAEALVAALLKFRTKCLSKVFVVSTGGKAHGETIKQLENYFTAESGPKSKTESTRQPHSYLDQYKVDREKGNFNTNKGEDNYDEGEDISDKGEDNNDEGENNSNKGKGNFNEGEDISDKGENNINSRKHKNDQECDNSDKEDDNSYQSENNMNSRKENYDHEEDNINLRKDRSYEGESCTNSGKDNSYKGENCTNSGKDMYQSGQHQKEQLTAVNPEVLFDQLRNPPLEKHPLPAADKTPEDADDDCMLQEAPTPVAMAETSAGKLRKLKTPALMLSHLEKKVNTEATWMENEFKLRQEELEIRKEEVKNERMRIQLLQAEQQNRFRIEEERKNEEREERRQVFDRFGKMTDALLSLMQKYDLK